METTLSYMLMLQKYINSKQKNSEIKDYTLRLGNTSKDFIINDKKNRTKTKRIFFSVFNPVDTNNILDIHSITQCLGLLKKTVYWIIPWLVNGSNHSRNV